MCFKSKKKYQAEIAELKEKCEAIDKLLEESNAQLHDVKERASWFFESLQEQVERAKKLELEKTQLEAEVLCLRSMKELKDIQKTILDKDGEKISKDLNIGNIQKQINLEWIKTMMTKEIK